VDEGKVHFRGALVAWQGEKSCFYLDSFSFFLSAAMIATIQVVRQPAPANKTLKGFFEDLTSGKVSSSRITR
jgi:hypothetical protein